MTRPARSSEASAGAARPFSCKLAQIVVLDHPGPFWAAQSSRRKPPRQRQCEPERRLLPRRDDNQRGIRGMVQAVVDIDAIRIDRDRRERQSCEFQAAPREREAGILDPGLPPFEAEHTQRQSEAAAEAAGDDDLRGRTLDAPRDGKIGGYFPPQFQLAARVRIDRLARSIPRERPDERILAKSFAGKVSCAGTPIWKIAGPAVSS